MSVYLTFGFWWAESSSPKWVLRTNLLSHPGSKLGLYDRIWVWDTSLATAVVPLGHRNQGWFCQCLSQGTGLLWIIYFMEDVINDINNKTISSHKAADPWAVLCFVSYSWGEIGYLSPSIHLKLTRLNYRSRSKHWMFVEGRDCPSVCGGGWLRGLLLTSEEGCLGQFPWGLLTVRGPAVAVLLECVSSLNAVTCRWLVVIESWISLPFPTLETRDSDPVFPVLKLTLSLSVFYFLEKWCPHFPHPLHLGSVPDKRWSKVRGKVVFPGATS